MIRKYILLLLLLCFAPCIEAVDYFRPSTRIGVSAETIRLGRISSFSENSHSIYSNPASLYQLYRYSGSFFTTRFMDEVTYNSFSLAARTQYGIFGVAYYTAGIEDIPKTSISDLTFEEFLGDPNKGRVKRVGSFGYKNTEMKFAYQFSRNRNLHFGLTGNLYNFAMENYTASGFNMDLGVIYLAKKFEIACSFSNVLSGSSVSFSHGEEETLPLESTYAVKYNMDDFTLLGQLQIVTSDSKFLKAFGVNYNPNFLPWIHTSFGYKEVPIKRLIDGSFEDTKVGNYVIGIGLEFKGVSFDYAQEASDHKLFNHKHYFSVSFKQ